MLWALLMGLAAGALCAQESPPIPAVGPAPPDTEPTGEFGRTRQDGKRILGIFPNYRTTSAAQAPKLSTGEKFRLAARDAFDPGVFLTTGLVSGLAHSSDQFPTLGQGLGGYGKRYALIFADNATATLFLEAITPTLLKQDPRYYRRGQGPFVKRLGYSLSRILVIRSDRGHTQINGPELLGNFAAAGVGNVYYPAAERSWRNTFVRYGINIGTDAMNNLLREFGPDLQRLFRRNKQP